MNNYGQSCLDESESNDYVHARTAESGKWREMDEKGEKMKKVEQRKNNEKTWKFTGKDSEINVWNKLELE